MIKDNSHKYPILVRIFHWLMSIMILGMIAVGWYMAQLPEDAADKFALYPWHKSFGMLVLLLWPIRALIKAVARKPPYYGLSEQQLKLSNLAHKLLYVLMLLVPVSGYCMSVFGGHSVKIFGWEVPSLFAENEIFASYAHEFHEYLPWILLVFVGLHIAAVVMHHVYDRVNIMKRML